MNRYETTILIAVLASLAPCQQAGQQAGKQGTEQRTELPLPRDPAPEVRVLTTGDLAIDPEGSARMPATTLEGIATFASRFVQPPLRGPEEIASLGERTLVGLLRPDQHRWLEQFVQQNRHNRALAMAVECEFVQMDDRAFDRLVAPLLARKDEKVRYAVLAAGAKTTDYLAKMREVRGVNVIGAPRLLALPTQLASLSVFSQTSYVKDFEPRFDANGQPSSIEPVRGVVQDGMYLKSSCGFIEDGVLGLSLQAHWSELKRPMKKVELQVKGCASTVQIDVPELEVAEVEADVRLPSGSTALFELSGVRGRHQLVFVTAKAVDPAQYEPFGPGK